MQIKHILYSRDVNCIYYGKYVLLSFCACFCLWFQQKEHFLSFVHCFFHFTLYLLFYHLPSSFSIFFRYRQRKYSYNQSVPLFPPSLSFSVVCVFDLHSTPLTHHLLLLNPLHPSASLFSTSPFRCDERTLPFQCLSAIVGVLFINKSTENRRVVVTGEGNKGEYVLVYEGGRGREGSREWM